MQNIYVYDPYGKVGKLIWYKGRAFYSYVVTYNHSYEFLYNGLIDGRAVINCTVYSKDEIKLLHKKPLRHFIEKRQMIGDYIKDPSCGLGKVIKLRPGNELVYFFKANDSLHDGAIEPGSCPDNHGWWFSHYDIKIMKCPPPLASLIERRQQWK